MSDKTEGLLERLRRTEIGRTNFGGVQAGAFHDRPVNPDGPKAADYIAALEAERDALREAVKKAQYQFAHYADLHACKGTPDGDAKAHVNLTLANEMAQALAISEKSE